MQQVHSIILPWGNVLQTLTGLTYIVRAGVFHHGSSVSTKCYLSGMVKDKGKKLLTCKLNSYIDG